MPFTYKHPRPFVTVDCVVFGTDLDDTKSPLKVLLIRRGQEPFEGKWALPGGHVETGESAEDQGEDIEAAAHRELAEETGIKVEYLEQLCTFGKPNRDPRGRAISIAYFALVRAMDYEAHGGGDASDALWTPLAKAKGLAFDHDEILAAAITRLQAKIQYTPIGFHLLPERFTLGQLQGLYEAILMRELEKRNFCKRILATGILEAAGTEDAAGKPGPKATLYRFNKRAYKTVRNFTFEV